MPFGDDSWMWGNFGGQPSPFDVNAGQNPQLNANTTGDTPVPSDPLNPYSQSMGSDPASSGATPGAINSGQNNTNSAAPNTFGMTNLPGMAISLYETIKGAQNLNALNNTPYPEYGVGNELQGAYNNAQSMAKMGFTPQERAAFTSSQGQGSATNAYYATKMGGGLGSAIQGGLNAQNIDSNNKFAGQDAALHRQNIEYAGSLASQMQNQENIKTQADIQRRNQQEQAWGGAMNSGLTGLGNSAIGGLSWGSLLNTGMKLAPLALA